MKKIILSILSIFLLTGCSLIKSDALKDMAGGELTSLVLDKFKEKGEICKVGQVTEYRRI